MAATGPRLPEAPEWAARLSGAPAASSRPSEVPAASEQAASEVPEIRQLAEIRRISGAAEPPQPPPGRPADPAPGQFVGGDMRLESHDHGVTIGRAGTVNHHVQYTAASFAPVALPHRTGDVPRLAEHFHDRAIGESLAAEAAGWTRILAGTAGAGKTQLAAQAAEKLWESGQLDLLVWVAAGSRAAIEAAYAGAAHDVLGRTFPDPAEGARALLNWLRPAGQHSKRWLIVLDGVTDPADLADPPGSGAGRTGGVWLWPPAGPSGRVLVTSQRRDFPAAAGREVVTVPPFTSSEARDFLNRLLEHHGRTEPAAHVEALADRLAGLPYSLAHAASHIVSQGLTVPEYLARLADPAAYDAGADDATAASPVRLSIGMAGRMAPAARFVLFFAAVLAPEGAPLAVLTSVPARDCLAGFVTRSVERGTEGADRVALPITPEQVTSGVTALHRLHLVDRYEEGGREAVRVETPVRGILLDALRPEVRLRLVLAAADALADAWPEVEPGAAFARLMRTNAATLAASAGDDLHLDGIHPVAWRAGRSLGEWGRHREAAAYFRDLADSVGERLGAEHPDVLKARALAADWRGNSGDTAGAVAELTEVLPHQRRTLADDHLDVLFTRSALAHWREKTTDAHIRAELSDVLADCRRALGPDAPATLATRLLLASWDVLEAPEPVDADALLADAARVFGPDHSQTVQARHLVANRLYELGFDEQALAESANAVVAAERVLGPEHPIALISHQYEAYLHLWVGRAETAAAILGAVLPEQQRLLGADHVDTLDTRYYLAECRLASGDRGGALEDYAALLADQRRALGPDHLETLATLFALARSRSASGQYAAALIDYAELASRRSRVLGPDHADTLIADLELAQNRGKAGDTIGAVVALAGVLPDLTRVQGADHWATLVARHDLARFRGEAGDVSGAVADFGALLLDRERVSGPDDSDTEAARSQLAYWQARLPPETDD